MITEIVKAPQHSNTTDLVLDTSAMNAMLAVANTMADSKVTVPKHLQGAPSDCLAIVMQAAQWKMNPFAVAQKTHLVNGILGYEAQLVNAVVGSSTAVVGRFKYESHKEGTEGVGVRCGAILAGESDITWGQWIFKRDQTIQNSPLWKTDPVQQLSYLAVKRWARLYCPDVILGVYSVDELHDMKQERDITPTTASSTLNSLIGSSQPEAEPLTEIPGQVLTQFEIRIGSAENFDTLGDIFEASKLVELNEKEQAQLVACLNARHAEIQEAIDALQDPA